MQRLLLIAAAGLLGLLTGGSAQAGLLILDNASQTAIKCSVDNGIVLSVPAGERRTIDPLLTPKGRIDSVTCGELLKTRMMRITGTSGNGHLVLTGTQERVLNAMLYPLLPNPPGGSFDAMLDQIIALYQTANPQVLLNLVMDPTAPLYERQRLPELLGKEGFDVIELDTLYLGFLAEQQLIVPVTKYLGDPLWPVAQAAATYEQTLYGIPSWLCLDFLFSYNPALAKVGKLSDLLLYLSGTERPSLVGDFNGSWRLPAMYINAYVQTYGYDRIGEALKVPVDQGVIGGLVSLAETCRYRGADPCVDNTFHSGASGGTERILASGNAANDVGFSEMSFYAALGQSVVGNLTAVPMTWGTPLLGNGNPASLLYADAFVTSAAECAKDPCLSDSMTFATIMTSSDVKAMIAFTKDQPGRPPRRLLPATRPFYERAEVKGDPLYKQFAPVVSAETSQPFPNYLTADQQTQLGGAVCKALKERIPDYACKVPNLMLRPESRR